MTEGIQEPGEVCDLCGHPSDVLAADWSSAARSPFAVADLWVCQQCRPNRFAWLLGGVDLD
jgi:hypothetical protein